MKLVLSLSFLAAGLDLASARPANLHISRNHGRDMVSSAGSHKQIRSGPVWNTQLGRREVPQEHSHEKFLTLVDQFLQMDNPDGIVSSVFGLLGNAAAAAGQGQISNTDCLQQATADRAFTNAKAAGSVEGMTGALIYRALERNTGAVGQASVPCTAIQAVNHEIAAISQHQDPASDNAAAVNKAIVLELAVQISNIGGNPLDALQSGTFAPGSIGDPTAQGNSCDDPNDPEGCIFTQNLLIEDATEDEINAAVAASGSAGAAAECTPPPPPPPDCSDAVSSALASVSAPTTAAVEASTTTTAAVETSTTASAGSSTLDFGSCSDPTIIFADGLDGRDEPAFEPHSLSDFPHGSALGIKVITDFICQQLNDKCKAPPVTIDACNSGATAAQGATGQAAADAFNTALGF
ncbi:uncharacterized protein Z518_08485 [Rhinocladiella mackenziei CBS 650.93]|uniref:Cell wall protein n=1 Tax=Rhinocladiella mackenziei CBS 650.93 TaxID=1442369 RepID=A0A0D2I9M5_9EURO|nr:uncharacterized protein Z518_08485 [Rhinocladiella mackenziei CBS 650.93]KIX02544.1 hypothetical protein Z518_08485 [Rhinocladiella mackenziei CBS 650.93]